MHIVIGDHEIDKALQELDATACILEALQPLKREQRKRVVNAMALILEADEQVPGVFGLFERGISVDSDQERNQ